jgi:hypothetical protein
MLLLVQLQVSIWALYLVEGHDAAAYFFTEVT